MKLSIQLLTIVLLLSVANKTWSQKKAMDSSVYDSWKTIERNYKLSNNGDFVSYVMKPQEGDSYLYVYHKNTQQLDSIPRGSSPVFSESSQFLAFNVIPQADSVRALKLSKAKKDDFPKDSLFIINLKGDSIVKIADINKWNVPNHGGDWLAYMLNKETKKEEALSDTTATSKEENTEEVEEEKKENNKDKDTKKKKKSFKSKGKPLVFYRPATGDSLWVEKVKDYSIANDGSGAYVVQSVGDTAEVSKVLKFDATTFSIDTLFSKTGTISKIASDFSAQQCAFLFTDDTVKVKTDRLYYMGHKTKAPAMIIDTVNTALPEGWSALNKGGLYFSRDGSKLYFGAGNRPMPEPKDTLTDDEKVYVDVWSWMDKEIQPMQKKHVGSRKNRAYKCVFFTKNKNIQVLESDVFTQVHISDFENSNIGFCYVDTAYQRSRSWTGKNLNDIYKVNLITGEKSLVASAVGGSPKISEDNQWLVYYEPADSCFYSVNIKNGSKQNISKGIHTSLVDELHDLPIDADAYGIAGFTADHKYVWVYDRYDIWQLDLSGKTKAVCITKQYGREHTTALRYIKLDKEEQYIPNTQSILLSAFNDVNKQSGFYELNNGQLKVIIEGDYQLTKAKKAKNSEVYLWRKQTYTLYPELRISDRSFTNDKVISNTNPQQKDYIWGNIKLVNWTASDGLNHQGLLVTPENMDTTKQYPMMVYFYERYSDYLHAYRPPAPSRSTINWNFYASNGYVIFIPDIYYRTGEPGQCAYEAIVSGTLAMCNQHSFIDRNRMALQGQSWGGYQTAYLVTQTNLFKAAMAGAPVSNMTSAYGGIRWGSGMSRMFQYEQTQSRIGGTLWNKTSKYIENSPVFYAPQVETPLLIMHNDNDGAVPWYQGIEYFMALRRLNKPVWMLVYNNEEHNLTRRANCKDLSMRMMQFFNHYLKDKPMPVWMSEGLPATKKGETLGYETE